MRCLMATVIETGYILNELVYVTANISPILKLRRLHREQTKNGNMRKNETELK